MPNCRPNTIAFTIDGAVFQSPHLAMRVMLKTGVVVAFVEVFKYARQDLGLLVRKLDALAWVLNVVIGSDRNAG